MPRTTLTPRSRSWVFTPWQRRGAWLALCVACSPRATLERPGYSRTPAREPTARTAAPPPARPKARRGIEPAVLERLVAATDQPYPSQGHEPPAYLVRVWVNPEFLDTYRHWSTGSTAPVGTWLLAKHRPRLAPPTGASPLPTYTMHRDAEDWRYGAVTEEGLELPVEDGVCHDCHTQARADSVFGLPVSRAPKRDAAPSGSGGTRAIVE